ncbi:MAG: hypothetical protein ABIO43_09950 [Sphingomicrobium sp.]
MSATYAGAITFAGSRAEAVRERAKRGGLLIAICLAHGLAILWLATRPAAPPALTKPGISLVDIVAPGGGTPARAPPKPPRPTPDAVPPKVFVPSLLPALAPDAPQSPTTLGTLGSGTAVGGGCALAQAAGQAILGDPRAMAELEALPREARTEADAVMLWDGLWQVPLAKSGIMSVPQNTPAGVTPGQAEATPGAIRFVVQQVVGLASPECRDAPVLGPQFIPVAGSTRTTTVVIGSGAWRWADLIRPEENCPALGGGPCLTPVPGSVINRTPNN